MLPSQAAYLVVVPGSLGDKFLCYKAPMISAHVAHKSATLMAIKDMHVDVESWINLFVSAEEECVGVILGRGAPASVTQNKTLEKVRRAHTRTPRSKRKANPALETAVQLPGSLFDDELREYLDTFDQKEADR